MKNLFIYFSLIMFAMTPLHGHAGLFKQSSAEEQRSELRKVRKDTLEQLYSESPATQQELQNAAGYAVFSSVGVNLFVVASERGGGILHDNRSGEDTYMKMFSAGGGVGMGVKDFSVVFVFHTREAMEDFQSEGWDFSGKADANAQSEDKGTGMNAGVTAVPGTSIYQITDAGLALQATLQGTKFWADEDLN